MDESPLGVQSRSDITLKMDESPSGGQPRSDVTRVQWNEIRKHYGYIVDQASYLQRWKTLQTYDEAFPPLPQYKGLTAQTIEWLYRLVHFQMIFDWYAIDFHMVCNSKETTFVDLCRLFYHHRLTSKDKTNVSLWVCSTNSLDSIESRDSIDSSAYGYMQVNRSCASSDRTTICGRLEQEGRIVLTAPIVSKDADWVIVWYPIGAHKPKPKPSYCLTTDQDRFFYDFHCAYFPNQPHSESVCVDIGSPDPIIENTTYFMKHNYGWRSYSFSKTNTPNSTMAWRRWCATEHVKKIDYLSIDTASPKLKPPKTPNCPRVVLADEVTLQVLETFPFMLIPVSGIATRHNGNVELRNAQRAKLSIGYDLMGDSTKDVDWWFKKGLMPSG